MTIKNPIVFRDKFTSFLIEGDVPKAILVDGKRYELKIEFDSKPQRYSIKGAHDLSKATVSPTE